jgi:hypothetical protein
LGSGKLLGVVPGGRWPSQVTLSRLNHGPDAEERTADSVTATGYVPVLPSAQLGTQSFSQSLPCPVAAEAAQVPQVMSCTPKPSSAQASVMVPGRVLSRYGGALVQSATTRGRAVATEAVEVAGGGVAGAVEVGDDGGVVPGVVVLVRDVARASAVPA